MEGGTIKGRVDVRRKEKGKDRGKEEMGNKGGAEVERDPER